MLSAVSMIILVVFLCRISFGMDIWGNCVAESDWCEEDDVLSQAEDTETDTDEEEDEDNVVHKGEHEYTFVGVTTVTAVCSEPEVSL